MSRSSLLLPVVAAVLCLPSHAAQRAFVASYGSDSNTASNCVFTAPCRSFNAALSVVDAGGEILALDSAGYGAPTISKSVSLIGNPGYYAGIAASTGNAVTIATGGVSVTLRGLNINGVGATHGVNMTAGTRLSIENCVISNFPAGNGVVVNSLTNVRIVNTLIRDNQNGVLLKGGAQAVVANSQVMGNSNAGVMVFSELASSFTTASIRDSVLTHNDKNIYAYETTASALSRIGVDRSTVAFGATYGVAAEFAGGPAVVMIGGSMVMQNNVGFAVVGGGGATLETFGNNIVRMNGPDTGTVSNVTLR